jgi:hypothetical protein
MTAKDPFKAYTSTRNHADIAQCIARTVPGAAVLPGTKETVVNVQNPDGPILLTWVITQIANGSIIKVWRANSLAPGISRAEACF